MNRHLIIAGTEKAGTTALYLHLSKHPAVCASLVKETDFYRHHYSGNGDQDLASYGSLFPAHRGNEFVMLEASPGYLAEAPLVAPRIASLMPRAMLVFILREPTERLRSFFEHSRSQYKFSSSITFSQYVDACMARNSGSAALASASLSEWHLNGLRTGRYVELLQPFFAAFERRQILVIDYEDLKSRPIEVTKRVCQFAGLDESLIAGAKIEKANVTFSGRIKWLHKAALLANRKLEMLLRHRPELKKSIVAIYKRVNQEKEGYEPIDAPTRNRVDEYYKASNQGLAKLLAPEFSMSWIRNE